MRADGLSGIACEFRNVDENKNLFYIGDAWEKVTFDKPTRVAPRLAWSPSWTGETIVTTAILEGDWTTS